LLEIETGKKVAWLLSGNLFLQKASHEQGLGGGRRGAGGQEISELNDKIANNFLAGVLIVAIVIWWLN
jgi:hypothetical protein